MNKPSNKALQAWISDAFDNAYFATSQSSEDALVCKILSDDAAIMKTGQTRKW